MQGIQSIQKDNILLSKYKVLEEIGHGGMGIVYLTEDIRLGRKTAIKELVIRRTVRGGERDNIIQRFKREAQTTSSLNHPNIVTIFDVGEEDGRYLIAMEYLPGNTLKDLLDENYEFTLNETLSIIIQIASALAHAHENGIIHRDIKPENIKVLKSGIVKLMDFGIAGIENTNSGLTQDGSILGTIAYISPEQLLNSKNVTSQADLFSLGVLMYELFTGQLPFQADTIGATIIQIMSENPWPLSTLNESIPDRLESIVLKCLEKKPGDRFENAYKILEELEYFKHSLSNRELSNFIAPNLKTKKRHQDSLSINHLLITSSRNKFKILHIEDDLARQEILKAFIQKEGLPFDYAQATTIINARDLLQENVFDFAICDYMLKDGDLIELIELLEDTPLIMVTSINDPQTIISLMKHGAQDYIIKTNAMDEAKQIFSIINTQFGLASENLETVSVSNLSVMTQQKIQESLHKNLVSDNKDPKSFK